MASGNVLETIKQIEEGVGVEEVERLADRLGVPRAELFPVLGIPASTYNRLLNSQATLSSPVTERILRVGKVYSAAIEAFGGEDKARYWLRVPMPALAGKSPLSLLKTELGGQMVLAEINVIHHGGVF